MRKNTHSVLIGYVLWIFGFTGAHRFYYGRKVTGLVWLLTGGLFTLGWLVDLVLIPGMDREADANVAYVAGPKDYSVAWLLQTFGGVLGLHRFYLGRVGTGALWLVTGGLFLVGWAWDFWHLNEMIAEENRKTSD